MTSIGVTNRAGSYNQSTQVHDWKRRSERLVRASGRPYTIVRPGWFDYNRPNELQLVTLQGDTRHAGNASDGVVAQRQIAEVLVRSLDVAAAQRKTLELVAETGPATTDFEGFFGPLEPDRSFQSRRPIAWITAVADQISRESGLTRGPDIEDLVITSYLASLDSPSPSDVTERHLLDRCRRQLIVWAWEQGQYDEPLPMNGTPSSIATS